MTAPSIIILLLLIFLLFKPVKYLIIAAFALSVFGSLALLPPAVVGGVTLLPSPMALLMLIIKVMVDPRANADFFRNAFSFRYLGLLTAFTVVGVVGALLLPKLLIGQTYTFPMRSETDVIRVPLAPTSSNITQSAYVTISCLTAITFAVLVKTRGFVSAFRDAAIYLAALTIFTGVLESLLGTMGAGNLLEPFRTASYSIILDAEVSGVRRVIGLTPEASTYGTLVVTAMSMLIFCRRLYSASYRNKVVYPLIFGCAVMSALCTSSTAYVSMVVVILLYFIDASSRLGAGAPEEKRQMMGEFLGVAAMSLIGIILIFSLNETRQVAFTLIDNMVLKKSASVSYIERSSWNQQGLQTFLDTNGLGIGLGSARTSNFFVNIIASTGLLGSLLFVAFLIRVAVIKTKSANPDFQELVRGTKLSLVPAFVSLYLSGSTSDYGGLLAAFFGIIIGAATATKIESTGKKAAAN
jgi:hypothetical protein